MNKEKEMRNNDEIDLLELAKIIWLRRLFILRVTGIFGVLGLLIAFTSPKEYQTSCTLIPEAMDGGSGFGGSLGGLAALAGVDLNGMAGGGSTVNPALYRSVAQSTPFLLELMKQEFFFNDLGKKVSLYDYCLNHQKSSLMSKVISAPFYVLSLFKKDKNENTEYNNNEIEEILVLTGDQGVVTQQLRERILVTMDWELNVVTIEVEMQDPLVAAEVTWFTQNYITKYVGRYAVTKASEQLKFVEAQYRERKLEFEEIQHELALFRDQNQFVNTARARSEQERLQSEYNLAFGIYNQFAQQREQLKIELNDVMPVFTVLEPPIPPIKRSNMGMGMRVFVASLIGLFLGFFIIIFSRLRTVIHNQE